MHVFRGCWITDGEFASLRPRPVFHRQLEPLALDCTAHRDRHILFRRSFRLDRRPERACLFITADDYFKAYLNGRFVCQGPAPAYPQRLGYLEADVTSFLRPGRNVLAVHTLYQGLINRVWVSGDLQHGLLCDLEADGALLLCSDASFLTHPHTGYREIGTVGYDTQFLEDYDSAAPEAHFVQAGIRGCGLASRPKEAVCRLSCRAAARAAARVGADRPAFAGTARLRGRLDRSSRRFRRLLCGHAPAERQRAEGKPRRDPLCAGAAGGGPAQDPVRYALQLPL